MKTIRIKQTLGHREPERRPATLSRRIDEEVWLRDPKFVGLLKSWAGIRQELARVGDVKPVKKPTPKSKLQKSIDGMDARHRHEHASGAQLYKVRVVSPLEKLNKN